MKRISALMASTTLCALLTGSALAGPYEDGQAALTAKKFDVARSAFSEAAANGDARALAYLGIMYEFGMGVPVDTRQALQWLTLAADSGDAAGQGQLGDMYMDGRGVTVNYVQALKYYTLAARQNYVPAKYRLGVIYENGLGVTKDLRQAITWYGDAAKAGYPDALFRIAYFYFYGVGIPKDFGRAVAILRVGAQLGHARSLSLLGFAYDNGYGVPQDYVQAAHYYAQGASKGDTNALALLGEKYANGKGVLQDWGEAYMLLSLAASKNEGPVQQTLVKERDQAASHLDTASLTKAQSNATQCAESNFATCIIPGAVGNGLSLFATGSAFFISKAGEIVTNHHVVDGCAEMRLDGKALKLMAADKESDLAILSSGQPRADFAHLRGTKGDVLGESVVAMGFPLNDILGRDPIVTTGVLSSLKGLNGNAKEMQFSAPIQPGNSGGPVLGADGAVVGVAHATLDGLEIASVVGVMPENVNFAVTLAALKDFLKAHKIAFVTGNAAARKDTADIAAEAKRYTVLLECWK